MAHLDLDDLRPEAHTLTFRGVEYGMPGQVPVPTILRVVELEKVMRDAAEREETARAALVEAAEGEALEDEEAEAARQKTIEDAMRAYEDATNDPAWENAVSETYSIVMELLRDENDDVPELRLSAQECNAILATIKSGKAPSAESVRAGRALAETVAEEVGLVGVTPEVSDGSEAASGPPTALHGAPTRGKSTRTTGRAGSARQKPSRKPSSE